MPKAQEAEVILPAGTHHGPVSLLTDPARPPTVTELGCWVLGPAAPAWLQDTVWDLV